LLLLMPALAAAQSRSGTVASIGDGDTLRVRQGQRTITVRLACIDATEMAQQPHGQRAREVLRMR
jgi:endonuclease YncB( thermonuclease family)